MNRTLVSSFTVAALLGQFGLAHAEDIKGGFCRVEQTRVSNTGQGVLQKELWEFTAAKLPDAPVLGWIDIACADRGQPRSTLQDFGKRIWFNVAGPSGGSVHLGRLSLSDSNINAGVSGDTGISIRGLAIYGVITPQHDCAYEVRVWTASCPSDR